MAGNSKYVLVEKVSRGGMAEIYLGRQEGEDGFKRVCCIKRILPHYARDKEYIEMFRDEAHICKRLQHANIVRVEGFEEVDNSYAIIMEFVDGGDLRKLLVACESKDIDLPIPIALYIAAEVAKGLHYAHTKIDEITQKPLHIVHRDISPQNILVSFAGEVKFTDFGIADAKSKSNETKPGIVKGKYSYMSPEQIMAKAVDARTDLFALTIVLWEMLAMERLFHGENDVITIQKVKNCELKQFPNRRDGTSLDPELQKIVLKGLQKDPKKRYQNGQEMDSAIRAYLSRKYPEFGAADLSKFLKDLLATQHQKTKEVIKRALTAESISQDSSSKSSAKKPAKRHTELNLDLNGEGGNATPDFSVARSIPRSPGGAPAPSSAASRLAAAEASSASLPADSSRVRRVDKNHRRKTSSMSKSKTSNSMKLFGIVAVAAALLLYIGANSGKSSKSGHSYVELRTTPRIVQLTLDGKKIKGKKGYYHRTKVKVKVSPGDHTLEVSRNGYQKKVIKFTADPGEVVKKNNLVLVPLDTTTLAAVDLRLEKNSKQKKVWFEIDGGIEYDYLPKQLAELVFGSEHRIDVYPHGRKKRKSKFTCKFLPESNSWRRPHILYINTREKTCRSKTD